MSKTYLPYEPDQQLLLPAALQEWLPDDHLAYFISDVVDQLDMSEVTARYERERRGGPPYHPRMMVKVLLYGLRSSRRTPSVSTAFRVLAANNTPDFRTTFARIIWMRRACSYRSGVVPAGGAGEALAWTARRSRPTHRIRLSYQR